MRGTESLGGGLNAIFQIESNVQADAGGSTLATRETFVGLQGAWGTVKIGNFLAPYDDIHPIFGNVPTLTTSILSTAAVWAQGGSSKANGGFDARARELGPLRLAELRRLHRRRPVRVGRSARRNRTPACGAWAASTTTARGRAASPTNRTTTSAASNLTDQAFSVAGGYNFGIVRVGGVWERLDYDTATGNLKRDFWGVGLTGNFGPGQMYAFFGMAYDGKGGAANGTRVGQVTKGNDTGANQWAISYTYPLSKRTLTYVGYVKIDNDKNAQLHVQHQPVPGVRRQRCVLRQRGQAGRLRAGHGPLLLSRIAARPDNRFEVITRAPSGARFFCPLISLPICPPIRPLVGRHSALAWLHARRPDHSPSTAPAHARRGRHDGARRSGRRPSRRRRSPTTNAGAPPD